MSMSRKRGRGRAEKGAQLLELAFALPVLFLLLLGIWDFGAAFVKKEKLTNAAREAARITISTPLNPTQTCGKAATPCSIVAAADAATTYLTKTGMDASCIDPATPTGSSGLSWTWTCLNGVSLTINRQATIQLSASTVLPAAEVGLQFPVTWQLARFLGSSSFPSKISTKVTMQILVP
jgi:Flp pilus assembly protein TadG